MSETQVEDDFILVGGYQSLIRSTNRSQQSPPNQRRVSSPSKYVTPDINSFVVDTSFEREYIRTAEQEEDAKRIAQNKRLEERIKEEQRFKKIQEGKAMMEQQDRYIRNIQDSFMQTQSPTQSPTQPTKTMGVPPP